MKKLNCYQVSVPTGHGSLTAVFLHTPSTKDVIDAFSEREEYAWNLRLERLVLDGGHTVLPISVFDNQ